MTRWNLDKAIARIVERIGLSPVNERPELVGAVTMQIVSGVRAAAAKELGPGTGDFILVEPVNERPELVGAVYQVVGANRVRCVRREGTHGRPVEALASLDKLRAEFPGAKVLIETTGAGETVAVLYDRLAKDGR